MAGSRREERTPHWILHAFLVATVIYTVYPVLWVITIALSGKQSLAIADLPADPTRLDRARAVLPWPTRFAFSNFTSVMTETPTGQPIAIQPRCGSITRSGPGHVVSAAFDTFTESALRW